MKKILLCLLTIFLLSACTSKPKTVELNHEQLMAGDFSSIAGDYESSNGHTITINNEGLQEGYTKEDDKIYFINGIYQMRIRWNQEPEGAITMTIYPVEVEVNSLSGITDMSKIRLSFGQAEPLHEEEIYTKK